MIHEFKVGDTVKLSKLAMWNPKKIAKILCEDYICWHLDTGTSVEKAKDGLYMTLAKPPKLNEVYTLIRNGDAVVVKDRNGNKGVAKCNPADTFNFATGVDIAMKRLKGEMKPFSKRKD